MCYVIYVLTMCADRALLRWETEAEQRLEESQGLTVEIPEEGLHSSPGTTRSVESEIGTPHQNALKPRKASESTAEYLERRKLASPLKRYGGSPVTSNQQFGSEVDSAREDRGRHLHSPEFGRKNLVEQTFFRPSGIF